MNLFFCYLYPSLRYSSLPQRNSSISISTSVFPNKHSWFFIFIYIYQIHIFVIYSYSKYISSLFWILSAGGIYSIREIFINLELLELAFIFFVVRCFCITGTYLLWRVFHEGSSSSRNTCTGSRRTIKWLLIKYQVCHRRMYKKNEKGDLLSQDAYQHRWMSWW